MTMDALARFGTIEFQRDPYPFLRWLRENDPVHRTPRGFYLISRHTDVDRVMRNADGLFRAADRSKREEQFPDALQHRSLVLLVNSLPSLNAPVHTRLRRLVARDFTPRRVAELRTRITEICDGLLDRIEGPLRDGEIVDLHRTLTKPMAIDVISELLGIPVDDRQELARDTSELAAALGSRSEDLFDTADERAGRLEDYFRRLIALRQAEPAQDLVTALARTHADGDQLTDDELMAMLWVMWNSGFEGTASSIEHGVVAMWRDPDQLHWLDGDLADATAFADEVLRHTGPQIFLGVSQIPSAEVTLSGVTLPAGAELRPVLAAANRDPEAFDDPDRFNPGRDNSRSVVFGQGAHHCLGAFLARTEIAIALTRLRRRFPTLTVAGEPVWQPSFSMRMATGLPVALARQPATASR